MRKPIQVTLLALAALAIASCASVGGKNTMTATSIDSQGEPSKSQIAMTADGDITSSTNGIAGGAVLQDAGGTYYTGPGAFGTLTLDKGKQLLFVSSPGDSVITADNLIYNDSFTTGTIITADSISISVNNSDVASIQRLAFSDAAEIIKTIAPEQRLETVQRWQEAGSITDSVAVQLVELITSGGI